MRGIIRIDGKIRQILYLQKKLLDSWAKIRSRSYDYVKFVSGEFPLGL